METSSSQPCSAAARRRPVRAALPLVLTLLAAGLIIYPVLWPEAPVMQGDSQQYLDVAADLADGRVDRLHDRSPGYPLFLTMMRTGGQPTRSLFFASLLLHATSVWLLAGLLRAAGAGTAWVVAFTLVLLLPVYVEPAAHVMTETLGQFTLVVGLTALVGWMSSRRPMPLAIAALAFGFAALTRPVYQGLAPAIALGMLVAPRALARFTASRRDALRAGVALFAGTLLVVGGFAWLNHARFGYFGISPLLGFHLATKTILLVDRVPDEYATVREVLVRRRDAELVRRGGTHTGSQTIWEAREELHAATGLATPALSQYLLRMNLALIRRAPVEYLQEVARSAATYWFPAGGPLAGMRSTPVRWLGVAVHSLVVAIAFAQLVVLAGFGLFAATARLAGIPRTIPAITATPLQASAYLHAAFIVFYTMAVTCLVDIGEPRQRRPTDALLVFLCFLGAHVWLHTLTTLRVRGASSGAPR